MLPDNRLATTPVVANWIHVPDTPMGSNFFLAEGGSELQNPSEGITGQIWKIKVLENKYVYLESLNYPETLIHTGEAITGICLAFDVNMNYCFTFIDKGVCYLSWFDTVAASQVITSFGEGISTPVVELDDKREMFFASADVVFAYIKDNKLYHRLQRERFTIERLLDNGPFVGIVKVGMNTANRLQFKLIPLIHRDETCNVIPNT